jgi:phage terminase large subunit GpA-like protein
VRFVALHVRCPHCGEHHEIRIDDAVVHQAASRLTPAALPGPSPAA